VLPNRKEPAWEEVEGARMWEEIKMIWGSISPKFYSSPFSLTPSVQAK